MEINNLISEEQKLFDLMDEPITEKSKEMIYQKLDKLFTEMDENNWAYEQGSRILTITTTQAFLSQLDDEAEIEKYVLLFLQYAPINMHQKILIIIEQNFLGQSKLNFLYHLLEINTG